MKAPAPYWETTYAADRRKHRHRCACCAKVIQPGMAVLMARTTSNVTKALHVEHADAPVFAETPAFTWRDWAEAQGIEYLRACGWKVPQSVWSQAQGPTA